MENLLPLRNRSGVVEMDDGIFAAVQGLKCLFDNVLPSLSQNLNSHVIRDKVVVDKSPAELILGLAGCREADLDLFKAHLE